MKSLDFALIKFHVHTQKDKNTLNFVIDNFQNKPIRNGFLLISEIVK